jgi:exodeoxyribonuclease VII small subunit
MVQLFNEEEKESAEGLDSSMEGGLGLADGTAAPAGSGDSTVGAVRFEDAYRRLEALVAEMERGDLPLEQLLSRFEEGVGLVRHCRTFLKQAQLRVEQFVEQRDGQWILKDVE